MKQLPATQPQQSPIRHFWRARPRAAGPLELYSPIRKPCEAAPQLPVMRELSMLLLAGVAARLALVLGALAHAWGSRGKPRQSGLGWWLGAMLAAAAEAVLLGSALLGGAVALPLLGAVGVWVDKVVVHRSLFDEAGPPWFTFGGTLACTGAGLAVLGLLPEPEPPRVFNAEQNRAAWAPRSRPAGDFTHPCRGLDFVGRVESLGRDWRALAARVARLASRNLPSTPAWPAFDPSRTGKLHSETNSASTTATSGPRAQMAQLLRPGRAGGRPGGGRPGGGRLGGDRSGDRSGGGAHSAGDNRYVLALCRILLPDFACLGYALPTGCAGAIPPLVLDSCPWRGLAAALPLVRHANASASGAGLPGWRGAS